MTNPDVMLEDEGFFDHEPKECIDDTGEGACRGVIEFRSTGRGGAFPRCEYHFGERLRREDDIRQLESDVPPAWFDPAYAGEQWDAD